MITLPFADADPNVQLDPAQQLQLYVVPTLTANASSAPKSLFQIEHVTTSSSSAEDASADLPLSLEYQADTSSGVVQALPPRATPTRTASRTRRRPIRTAPTRWRGHRWRRRKRRARGEHARLESAGHRFGRRRPLGRRQGGDQHRSHKCRSDSDGFCDGPLSPGGCTAGDNCPNVSNGAQINTDALSAGDACQCGDVTGEGPVTAADYQRAREYVVDPGGAGFFDAESCDVNGDGVCDVEDLAVLDRAVAGVGTVVDACEAYTGGP